MPVADDEVEDDDETRPPVGGPPAAGPAAPLGQYRAALARYDGATIVALARESGLGDPPPGREPAAAAVADFLAEGRSASRLVGGLEPASRLVLGLFGLTETPGWPVRGLGHALACLGVETREALGPLLRVGLVVAARDGSGYLRDPEAVLDGGPSAAGTLLAHPAAAAVARTTLPGWGGLALPRSGPVRKARESDGLEPLLRMAVVWQRADEAPLRQTQQGTLYKRDRDRIEDDPVIAGPVADALEPLPDMPALWMELARGVGLLVAEPGSERVAAAPPAFWSENAYHLPQMTAVRWLTLRHWHELGGLQREGATAELALPYARPAVLLWLATLGDDEWVAAADFARFLRDLSPDWDRPAFADPDAPAGPNPPPAGPAKSRTPRPKARESSGPVGPTAGDDPGSRPLEAMLFGPAYQFGLVRVAEEEVTGRRVVRLSAMGRYVLAIGPPPPPPPAYEQFLFVQPSFEIIAYRQGLTPALIGQFSRFALWSQIGAALALRLTPESVYRGLEGGLTAEAVLDRLARHNARPLPPGVAEAVRGWAGRRDRVTYHASATLVEFATAADLDRALSGWPADPAGVAAPVRVSDRLLLVEDEASIPFRQFRMTGARDYRRPPEACVEVEPDGVTLSLDLARSDLLVDAELGRFAVEQSADDRPSGGTRRRFAVSAASLARAADGGMTAAQLSHWYLRRTGADVPPALRLILAARASRLPPLRATRPVLLRAPSAEVLDGLAQHPATRDHLGERLGPTAVLVAEDRLAPLRKALEHLGLELHEPDRDGDRDRDPL